MILANTMTFFYASYMTFVFFYCSSSPSLRSAKLVAQRIPQ